MDPVTAIQVASAVFTFIQAGAAVLKTAKEIHDSADGLSDDARNRRVIVGSMEGAIAKLMEAGKSESSRSLSALVAECQNLSRKIKDCLEKIETSRLGRFGTAGKVLFKKNELEGLETRLDRCRSQLEVELGNLRDERLTGYFETLVSLAQHNNSKFEQLSADVRQLSEGVQRGQIGNEARDQLKDLLGIQEQAVCTDYIVRSLRFDGMGRRYESVQQRNQKTFEWIFESEEPDEGYESKSDEGHGEPGVDEESLPPRDFHTVERLEMKREAREKFLGWLSSPTGIFHISGKLGSGKSTLMKFLYSSRVTRAQVENWAGSRKLVFANVFFWKPGSEMQKSLDGLCRSLLYGILQKFPDLTREVLHEYWSETERTLLQSRPPLDIPPDAIRKALEEIITNRQVNKGRCFCFFLDALDEYDDGPRHQHDQLFLVDLLQRWVKASEGRLALCVSSREDNVFMNAFPEAQRLQLHKLTLFDIRNYTRHALAHFPDETIRNHLIKVIPHRAEGIFLWAVLVIKNLRRMIPDGHIDTHELDELLDELPSELEDLLRHIIDRLSKSERKTAYQVIELLRTAHSNELYLSLLAFSFLGEYEKDQTFAFRNDFPTSEMQGIREDDAFARYSKKLRRVCGGLVELPPARHPSEHWDLIEFTHRSVPEMFEESELKKAMESALTGFNPVVALSHLICAQSRFLNNTYTEHYPNVVEMLLQTGAENGSYTHLEFIDSHDKALRPRDLGAYSEIFLHTGGGSAYPLGFSGGSHVSADLFFDSVLCNAVESGHTKYVRWKLRNDPHALDDPLERSVAVQLMFDHGIEFWAWDYPVCTGVFNDESRVKFVYYREPESADLTTDELTTWERHLVWGFLAWEDGRHRSDGRLARHFGEVAELFLQHGAATDLVVLVKGAREKNGVVLRFDHAEVIIKYWNTGGNGLKRLRSMRCGKGDDQRDTHVTLRDWIEATDLENKDRLLGLIDSSRERVLERCDTSRVTDVAHSRVEEEDKTEAGERKALGGKDVAVDVEAGQVSTVHKVALALAVSILICSVWAKLDAWKGR